MQLKTQEQHFKETFEQKNTIEIHTHTRTKKNNKKQTNVQRADCH